MYMVQLQIRIFRHNRSSLTISEYHTLKEPLRAVQDTRNGMKKTWDAQWDSSSQKTDGCEIITCYSPYTSVALDNQVNLSRIHGLVRGRLILCWRSSETISIWTVSIELYPSEFPPHCSRSLTWLHRFWHSKTIEQYIPFFLILHESKGITQSPTRDTRHPTLCLTFSTNHLLFALRHYQSPLKQYPYFLMTLPIPPIP